MLEGSKHHHDDSLDVKVVGSGTYSFVKGVLHIEPVIRSAVEVVVVILVIFVVRHDAFY